MFGAIITWLAESDAEQIGRYTGGATAFILLAAGIAKCHAIAQRRNTNAKAARGLMLLLMAWLLAMIGGNVVKLSDDDALRLPVLLTGGLLAIMSAVAGGVLAAIGVAEIRANRLRYTQGMRQAVTALALCAGMLALCGAGVYHAVRRAGGADEVASLASAEQPEMGKAIRCEKFNFVFDMPARPWVKTEASKLSSDACLALMRTRPQIGFQIIAEDGSGPLSVDAAGLAEIAMANLASVATEHHVLDKQPHALDGIDGLRVVSRARVGGHEFAYVHWVASHGGHLYQLVTWGKPSEQEAVRAASDEMARNFRLIDRHKEAPPPPAAVAQLKSHRSDRYGYSLRLRGDGWTKWQQAAEQMPLAEFAAEHGEDTVVAAMPVALLGADAPSPEALFDAMLVTATGIEPAQVTDRRRIDHHGMSGYNAAYSRFHGGARYDYRFLAVRSSRFAYFCAGWTSNRGKVRQVEESVASMLADALPPHAFETGAMSPMEKLRHGLVFNELGLAAFTGRQFAQAAALFDKSLELRPDEVVAESVVVAHMEAGQARDAFAAAERAVARYPHRPTLRARAAFLQAQAGNEPAAIDAYAKVFAQGHQDDLAMGHYLTLLAKGKRLDDAIAAAERYQRRFNARTVAMDLSILLGMKGEHARAAEMLAKHQQPGKFDAELAVATAEQQLYATRFADAQATIERAIAAGEQSALAYWIRGEAETGLGRYPEAKASFEAAAAKAPADERIAASIKYVSALLGEGDNSLIKESIEPVALPASLAPRGGEQDDAAVAKLADGSGGCYLNRAVAVSFAKGKEHKTTEYRVIRVLDASGVEAFNTFTFRFDPLFDRVFVNRLDVRDAAGKVVASGRVADYFVTDENDAAGGSGVASQRKVLTSPCPGSSRATRSSSS